MAIGVLSLRSFSKRSNSKLLVVKTFSLSSKARVLTIQRAFLMPVNEPGPRFTASKSISFNLS